MRPEGWDKRLESWFKRHPGRNIERVVYEAGADAMLEGLKKHPFPVGHLANTIFLTNLPYDATLIEHEGKKGYLVFIPEDKE